MAKKEKNEADKIRSSLMKDVNRIRKQAEVQAKMNLLRKYQLTQLNKFIKKLLKEGRISKEEIKEYNVKKGEAEKKVFGKIS
jgi:tRNA splicing ligase